VKWVEKAMMETAEKAKMDGFANDQDSMASVSKNLMTEHQDFQSPSSTDMTSRASLQKSYGDKSSFVQRSSDSTPVHISVLRREDRASKNRKPKKARDKRHYNNKLLDEGSSYVTPSSCTDIAMSDSSTTAYGLHTNMRTQFIERQDELRYECIRRIQLNDGNQRTAVRLYNFLSPDPSFGGPSDRAVYKDVCNMALDTNKQSLNVTSTVSIMFTLFDNR
jgi:hypothetical protein